MQRLQGPVAVLRTGVLRTAALRTLALRALVLRTAALRVAILAAGLLGLQPALACPVCASGSGPTVVEALQDAERAVLTRLDSEGRPRVIEVIKGPAAVGESLDLLIRPATPSTGAAPSVGTPAIQSSSAVTRAPSDRPLLMLKSAAGGGWSLLGAVDEKRAHGLRSLVLLEPASALSASAWTERVRRFLVLLEDPEPLVAETAYSEISRAPYAAMRAARDQLDGPRLARWAATPALADRRPLYLLLLGLSGTPDDAQSIERQLLQPSLALTRTDLPALVAAQLELGGPDKLDWLESHWLLNEDRPVSLLQPVLVALSVHGGEQGRISRQAIVKRYLRFIERRPELSGFVAQDLADWGIWEATPQYAQAIQLTHAPIASRVAMAQYLRLSPHPLARDALRRAIGR